jgi:hypothetical protein
MYPIKPDAGFCDIFKVTCQPMLVQRSVELATKAFDVWYDMRVLVFVPNFRSIGNKRQNEDEDVDVMKVTRYLNRPQLAPNPVNPLKRLL